MSIVTYDTAGGIPRTTINVNPDDKDVRIAALEAERDTLRDELEVARRTKLLAWMDGLTANLGIIKEESDKAFRLFVQANAAKRKNFANWQSAAAENRRLVGMEQDAQHYKEEMEEAQADARALATACEKLVAYRKRNNAITVQVEKLDDYINNIDAALSAHGARYLEAEQ